MTQCLHGLTALVLLSQSGLIAFHYKGSNHSRGLRIRHTTVTQNAPAQRPPGSAIL